MSSALDHFPALVAWTGLAALLAAMALLSVLGGGGGGGGGGLRRRETDLAAGWGLASLAFTVGGIVPAASSQLVALAVAAGALLAGWSLGRRKAAMLPEGIWRFLVIALPLLAVATAAHPYRLADFEYGLWSAHHWLLSDRPVGQAMASLPVYLAARLGGRLFEQAGALAGIVALSMFGLAVARIFVDGQGVRRPGWGVAAGGFVAAFVATPALDIGTMLGTGSETASAVLLALSAILAQAAAEAIAAGRSRDAVALGWKLGLALAGTSTLAPGVVPLAGALLAGLAFLGWREGGRLSAWLLPVAIAALVAALSVAGQWLLPTLPLSAPPTPAGWRMPATAWEWLRFGGHFGIMAVAFALAARGLVHRGGGGRLAILFAVAALAGLALPLLSGIGWWEVQQRLSALAALAVLAWLAECRHWPEPSGAVGPIAAVLVGSCALAVLPFIRFDRVPPVPTLRQIAAQTGDVLGQGDRIAVFDLAARPMTLAMLRWSARGRGAEIEAGTPERVPLMTHVLVRGGHPVAAMLGIDPADGHAVLLRRSKEGWVPLRRWGEPAGVRTGH